SVLVKALSLTSNRPMEAKSYCLHLTNLQAYFIFKFDKPMFF
ncbi:MAG: hypothetical protein ACI9FJ_001384, partial [Alteromonadaceae bacterium]